jgi:hypothetical protein
MLRRKTSWLSDDDWLAKPWFDAKKSSRDDILDIIARVPGALQRLDRSMLETPVMSVTAALAEFRASHSAIMEDVASWRQRSGVNHSPTTAQDSMKEIDPSDLDEAEVPQELECLCSTMQYILHRELVSLHGRLAAEAESTSPPNNPAMNSPPRGVQMADQAVSTNSDQMYWSAQAAADVDRVVSCIDSCLVLKAGVLTATRMVFPALMVARALELQGGGKLEHMLELFRKYQQESGSPVVDLLWDCATYLKCNPVLRYYNMDALYPDGHTSSATHRAVSTLDRAINSPRQHKFSIQRNPTGAIRNASPT